MLFRYLEYIIKSKTKYDIHSPFMFELITGVINANGTGIHDIELLRKNLVNDNTSIEVTDFGAKGKKKYMRSISSIARSSAKNKKYCTLLYRIVKHFKPLSMLELGTSLGISTIYQAKANPAARFISLEGCPETARIAQKNLSENDCKNIQLICGEFSETLPAALSRFETLDYAFFDGNHQKGATLHYFNTCLAKSHDKSIFIFDDINWSGEMREAWKEIKNHPSVTVTVDLFFLGIVFFDKNLSKQNFMVRF